MKQLAVVSGKGGTGKTTVTAYFSNMNTKKVIVDCDVDASNLHLILDHRVKLWGDFYSGKKAVINTALCAECGKCMETCRFDAITANFKINSLLCNGCGSCTMVCPQNAIKLSNNRAGKWLISDSPKGPFIHAELGIAEDNSGKLVSYIRKKAEKEAERSNSDLILIDGPPGIGCPVISSITGVDLILIVTEPSQSGLHDALRINKVAQNFGIPTMLCINKYDLNTEVAEEIKSKCISEGIEFAGSIPFNNEVVDAISAGDKFMDKLPLEIKSDLYSIWKKVINKLEI